MDIETNSYLLDAFSELLLNHDPKESAWRDDLPDRLYPRGAGQRVSTPLYLSSKIGGLMQEDSVSVVLLIIYPRVDT